MLEKMKKDMRAAIQALKRKIIKAEGAAQIAKIVLTPQMKYKMVLSNTNEREIGTVQSKFIVKEQLCNKYRICSKTRNQALW